MGAILLSLCPESRFCISALLHEVAACQGIHTVKRTKFMLHHTCNFFSSSIAKEMTGYTVRNLECLALHVLPLCDRLISVNISSAYTTEGRTARRGI